MMARSTSRTSANGFPPVETPPLVLSAPPMRQIGAASAIISAMPSSPPPPSKGPVTQALLWTLRAAWAAAPLVNGPALASYLSGWPSLTRAVTSVALWAVWGVILLASLVPHPITLTVARVVMPAGAVVVALTAVLGHPSVPVPVLAAGLLLTPQVGAWFTNGLAYANEVRFNLRPPGWLMAGPILLFWSAIVAPPVASAILWRHERLPIAAVVAAVGVGAMATLGRSLYGLARRWVVFVPAGMVLHDPLHLVDPVLFQTKEIERLGPAPAASDSLDLTGRALGLALELELKAKAPMSLHDGRKNIRQGSSARLLFTPSQPASLLAEAERRRISVD